MKILTPILRCLSHLPLPVLYCLSDVAYGLVRHVLRYRRAVVRENIATSFPEMSTREHRRVERGFYHFLCDYGVETLKLMTFTSGQMRRHMRFENVELAREAAREHKLVFVFLGHYCNWEWVSSLPLWLEGKDVALAQLYRPLSNRRLDRLFLDLRQRFGAESIPKYEAPRHILAMRQGQRHFVIGFIGDQSPHPDGIHAWMDFLCHDTPLLTGGERIAQKVGAEGLYLDVRRERRGHYVARFERLPQPEEQGPTDYPMTRAYMRALEQSIRRQPQYWLWSHRRWKHSRAHLS